MSRRHLSAGVALTIVLGLFVVAFGHLRRVDAEFARSSRSASLAANRIRDALAGRPIFGKFEVYRGTYSVGPFRKTALVQIVLVDNTQSNLSSLVSVVRAACEGDDMVTFGGFSQDRSALYRSGDWDSRITYVWIQN